jgi:hypothetical protein
MREREREMIYLATFHLLTLMLYIFCRQFLQDFSGWTGFFREDYTRERTLHFLAAGPRGGRSDLANSQCLNA